MGCRAQTIKSGNGGLLLTYTKYSEKCSTFGIGEDIKSFRWPDEEIKAVFQRYPIYYRNQIEEVKGCIQLFFTI